MTNPDSVHPFSRLDPSYVADAVESCGYITDGRIFALNSYENRVYQIGIEESEPLIGKFYRPDRWTKAQIQEEHDFCFELCEDELPVVAPLVNKAKESIFEYGDFMFSLFPRKGGRAPELDNPDNLVVLGRFLARIHNVGAAKPFIHRPEITPQNYGHESVAYVSASFIPGHLQEAYDTLTRDLLGYIDQVFADSHNIKRLRVHGDCHIGNMLWRDDAPHFIDFDDCRTAPAIQDLFMLLSGSREEQRSQMVDILDGYQEFADFDKKELRLIESFRTLRMLHFSAWLARRWDDPAFPMGFPWFNTSRYWEEHILTLREQLAELHEPTIEIIN
jgi:Ser/Thr protein kinase RdoA (MazF antagonist)